MHRENLGRMLLAANLIDEVQMQIALAEQQSTGRRFGSTLVDLKFIDENVLAAFLSKQMDLPCISLHHIDVPRKLLRRIPATLARECQAIPVRIVAGRLEVAMVDPTDIDRIRLLETATGLTVSSLIAPQSSILEMIERFYPEGEEEDTETVRIRSGSAGGGVTEPMFADLVAELESGDFEGRFDRIEQSLGEIWILLEKILRLVEARDPVGSRGPAGPVR